MSAGRRRTRGRRVARSCRSGGRASQRPGGRRTRLGGPSLMRITASAPGKLVLIGEYAVLEGAPALVLAVDRRARVTLETLAGDTVEIVSSTLQLALRVRIRHERIAWDGTAPSELAWVATLLAHFARIGSLPACRIELDSDPLYIDRDGITTKLGLGSSAALCVALLGALHAAAGWLPPTLDECVRAYRVAHGGRRSGIDIAASLAGGLSCFRLERGAPQRVAAQLPAGLHWCCVYSGRPASTSAMLATVAAWSTREPDAYAHGMHALAAIASRGVQAIAGYDAVGLLSSLDDFAHALARFGEAAGADIASSEHRAIGAIAARCDCVYKSCGAGCGDVGIACALERTRVRNFAAQAIDAGFSVIDLNTDPQGLTTTVVDQSSGEREDGSVENVGFL
ncbi:hypothetical protein EPN44_09655 [bacterium]|nr:MAG: hypothetical protein EPN44_09655 [bacterium]